MRISCLLRNILKTSACINCKARNYRRTNSYYDNNLSAGNDTLSINFVLISKILKNIVPATERWLCLLSNVWFQCVWKTETAVVSSLWRLYNYSVNLQSAWLYCTSPCSRKTSCLSPAYIAEQRAHLRCFKARFNKRIWFRRRQNNKNHVRDTVTRAHRTDNMSLAVVDLLQRRPGL